MRQVTPALVETWARATERRLRALLNEVDCRIEHGAESGGHLEYVRDRLRMILCADRERPPP